MLLGISLLSDYTLSRSPFSFILFVIWNSSSSVHQFNPTKDKDKDPTSIQNTPNKRQCFGTGSGSNKRREFRFWIQCRCETYFGCPKMVQNALPQTSMTTQSSWYAFFPQVRLNKFKGANKYAKFYSSKNNTQRLLSLNIFTCKEFKSKSCMDTVDCNHTFQKEQSSSKLSEMPNLVS